MVKVLRSFVRGPLESHVMGFADELFRLGYSRSAAEQHICFIAHLDRWMSGAGIGLDEVSSSMITRYLAVRRAAGYRQYRSVKALQPLLDYLAPLNVLPVTRDRSSRAGGGVAVAIRQLPSARSWADRGNGPRLCRCGAPVCGGPVTRRHARTRSDERCRCHPVRPGCLSGSSAGAGEVDCVGVAVAAELAATDRRDAEVARGIGPERGGLAVERPAESSGTRPTAPAVGVL
jgi:hypothetical protein